MPEPAIDRDSPILEIDTFSKFGESSPTMQVALTDAELEALVVPKTDLELAIATLVAEQVEAALETKVNAIVEQAAVQVRAQAAAAALNRQAEAEAAYEARIDQITGHIIDLNRELAVTKSQLEALTTRFNEFQVAASDVIYQGAVKLKTFEINFDKHKTETEQKLAFLDTIKLKYEFGCLETVLQAIETAKPGYSVADLVSV